MEWLRKKSDAGLRRNGSVAPTSIVIASASRPPQHQQNKSKKTKASGNSVSPIISAPTFSSSFLSATKKPKSAGPAEEPITPPPVVVMKKSPSTLRRHQTGISHRSHAYKVDKLDVWMLGITIVIGGQYFSWNAGFEAGLYSYMITYFLIAGAYITLCCCNSEVTGALPFAGGAYGLSRCTLGFFPGYLIGCCAALEYIAYVATSVVSLAQMIVTTAPILEGLEPVIALVFYISALFFHIRGDRVFWVFNKAVGSISLLIVLLFCFGSLPYVSFSKYADDPQLRFVNGFAGFMKSLPLAAWFFVGVEALSLASDQVTHPKVVIPFAQISCVLALFVTGVAVFFVTVSLPPGISHLPTELVPFNNCFELLFDVSHRFATILSLPATYATVYGFMWCYGKLIAAMAQSRLLPPFLASTTNGCGTPYAGICFGSAISYLVCLVVHFRPSIGSYLFSICITCAFVSYTGQCVGYISLKRNHTNIKSSPFKSPFGIAGALYSIVIWTLGITAIAGYQGNDGVEILSFSVGVVLLMV